LFCLHFLASFKTMRTSAVDPDWTDSRASVA
jgi:hypothetical protein